VRLLAPPTPARSCYARATDDRTTPARALLGKANGRGLGAQKSAPLTPAKVKGNRAGLLRPGGPGAAGPGEPGAGPSGAPLASTRPDRSTRSLICTGF